MENVSENSASGLDLYWRIAVRRRWWILIPFVLGWAAVLGATWVLPTRYRSEALILVQEQQVPQAYVVPNVTMDLAARMNTLTQQIMSRTRLLEIAAKFNLYPNVKDQDQVADALRKDIDIDLQTSKTSGRPDLSAFKLSYVNKNAQVAQQVDSELTSLFIDTSIKHAADASQQTTEFLKSQLDLARKDLDDQEAKLRQFKSQYLGELPEQLDSNLAILNGLQSRQQAAADALNRAEQQRVYLESLLSQYQGAARQVASADVPVTPAVVDLQLEKLHQVLADLQAKYTDKHPDVIRVKGEIAAAEALKAKLEKQIAAASETPGKKPSVSELQAKGPVMQIESQLKSLALEIANDKKDIADINGQISQYQSRLNLTPMREQQLAAIVRDHDQSQKNYDELLKKVQQSGLASSLESQQQGEQFKLIDPPNLPLKPYFPDRMKMALAGLGVGLALGLVFAGVAEFTDLHVFTESQVKSIVGATVMVVGVPSLWTPSELHRLKRSAVMQAAVASVLLLAVCSVTAFTIIRG